MSKTLFQIVDESDNIAVFTGAGISTASGIPDFRSSSGLYMTGEFENYKPEDILSRAMLRKNPALVLKFYKYRLLGLIDKQPNVAHLVLKKLEDSGKLKCIITQNIDNLHAKAGSTNVYELHGNIAQYRCNNFCKRKYTHLEFLEKLKFSDMPMCDCNASIIRPNVVLFDEWLNDDIFDNAEMEVKKCDLMIVIGSSLSVMPACSLVGMLDKNQKLVIINESPTLYDGKADLVINKNCGEVLEELEELIKNFKYD